MKKQQKIEALEEMIEELKAEEQQKENEWPQEGDVCFYVLADGVAHNISFNDTWKSELTQGRVFRTEKEAERYALKERVTTKLKRQANFEPALNDTGSDKWRAIYSYQDNQWTALPSRYLRHPGAVYFRTKREALDAHNALTPEEVKAYLS